MERAKETACRRNGADPVPDLIDGDKTGDHLQMKEERMTERNVPGRLKEADHREKDWKKTNDVYTPGKADMHNLEERFSLMADFFAEFASLSPIGHGFPELLERSRTFLYHSEDSRSRYEERQQEFRRNMPETEVCTERLLFYFLYSFVMPGFYDGDLYTKAKMGCAWRRGSGRAGDGGVFQKSREVWEENRRWQRERCRACNVSGK